MDLERFVEQYSSGYMPGRELSPVGFAARSFFFELIREGKRLPEDLYFQEVMGYLIQGGLCTPSDIEAVSDQEIITAVQLAARIYDIDL